MIDEKNSFYMKNKERQTMVTNTPTGLIFYFPLVLETQVFPKYVGVLCNTTWQENKDS